MGRSMLVSSILLCANKTLDLGLNCNIVRPWLIPFLLKENKGNWIHFPREIRGISNVFTPAWSLIHIFTQEKPWFHVSRKTYYAPSLYDVWAGEFWTMRIRTHAWAWQVANTCECSSLPSLKMGSLELHPIIMTSIFEGPLSAFHVCDKRLRFMNVEEFFIAKVCDVI